MPELGTSGTAGAAGGQLPAATRPPPLPQTIRPSVAGVQTPAFVECTRITIPLAFSTWCRRSADSGLAALGGDSAQSHIRATSSRASAPSAVV